MLIGFNTKLISVQIYKLVGFTYCIIFYVEKMNIYLYRRSPHVQLNIILGAVALYQI